MSLCSAEALKTIFGIKLQSGCPFNHSSNSKPLHFGIFKSVINTRGKGYFTRSANSPSAFRYAMASAPSRHTYAGIPKPTLRNARCSKNESFSSSSATRITKGAFHSIQQPYAPNGGGQSGRHTGRPAKLERSLRLDFPRGPPIL